MNLGVFAGTYANYEKQGMTIFDMVELAKQQGYIAFDAYNYKEFQTVDAALKLKKKAIETGLIIPCFSVGAELLGIDSKDAIEEVELYIEMAAAMGSPYLMHTLYTCLEFDENTPQIDNAIQEVAPKLRKLCKYATERGVTCLYENQGIVFNGRRAFGRLQEALNDVDFGFCLDVSNSVFVGDNPLEMWRGFSNKIRHIHVGDYYMCSKSEETCGYAHFKDIFGNYYQCAIIGQGIVDYPKLIKAIKESGYDGYLCLEYGGNEDIVKVTKASNKHLRDLYESC